MKAKAKKGKDKVISTRHMYWYARTFGPTEWGVWGIAYPVERVIECADNSVARDVSWNSVQGEDLLPALRVRLAVLLKIAKDVNEQVEQILRDHLQTTIKEKP